MLQVLTIIIGVASILGCVHGQSLPPGCRWVGTAPICEGSPSDCNSNEQYLVSSSCGDGATCVSGTKVLCCPISDGYTNAHWVGTAPFCDGECSDCGGNDCIFANNCGDGAACFSGQKVLCGIKGSVFAENGCNWICPPSGENITQSTCTGLGMKYLAASLCEGDCPNSFAALCCPQSYPYDSAYWVGNAPFCSTSCQSCGDDECIAANQCGEGMGCAVGEKVLCARRTSGAVATAKPTITTLTGIIAIFAVIIRIM